MLISKVKNKDGQFAIRFQESVLGEVNSLNLCVNVIVGEDEELANQRLESYTQQAQGRMLQRQTSKVQPTGEKQWREATNLTTGESAGYWFRDVLKPKGHAVEIDRTADFKAVAVPQTTVAQESETPFG